MLAKIRNLFKAKVKEINGFIRFITFGKRIAGITLAPFGIYVLKNRLKDRRLINHENIHWRQQLEMLIIFFYIWYLIEWFIRIFTNFGNSYRSISFEREAYANDKNFKYLESRKPFSWLRYIFKK